MAGAFVAAAIVVCGGLGAELVLHRLYPANAASPSLFVIIMVWAAGCLFCAALAELVFRRLFGVTLLDLYFDHTES